MFNQTEVKHEVGETTCNEVKQEIGDVACKREIDNKVDEVLQDSFKIEIKEEPTRKSTNDTCDYLDVKKCLKAEFKQDDGK
ncbi:unnamed protein product [Diabrotica balteata]|uniref:Uncharacterized protein n=1 Tax=Diabrotica balteata TaxID=107213 RepID=A0A9N9STR9_DIABA|nr:unnamed protein product [Diabrotica balteata]